MRVITYLLIASVLTIVIIVGFMMITATIEINTIGKRVEQALTAAGWAGFSEIDVDELARRAAVPNEEIRDVYLNKNAARSKVQEYIKKNLKLDSSNYPNNESWLTVKDHPVTIKDIIIYNPSQLPATAPDGKEIKNTSVYICVDIPLKIKFTGIVYKEISVVVDSKTFYSNSQK